MAARHSFQSNRKTSNSSNSTISWKQVFCSFILGVIATLALQHYINADHQSITSVDEENSVTSKDEEIHFDFFNILPNQTVDVGDLEQEIINYEYYLQVGSFQDKKDAETKRVELILLNLDANIEAANVNGNKVYRVIIGPYPKRTLMSKDRSQLITNGIKPLLLKRDIN